MGWTWFGHSKNAKTRTNWSKYYTCWRKSSTQIRIHCSQAKAISRTGCSPRLLRRNDCKSGYRCSVVQSLDHFRPELGVNVRTGYLGRIWNHCNGWISIDSCSNECNALGTKSTIQQIRIKIQRNGCPSLLASSRTMVTSYLETEKCNYGWPNAAYPSLGYSSSR